MPYLIFTANGEEFDRRELGGPTVLGRAPDCDITIPDIMLSRHHCRIEPTDNGQGWRIIDLHSKNGTHLRGRAIDMYVIREADELRIGRTRVTFMSEAFVPPTTPARRSGVIRPADPAEALAGTMCGMSLCEPGEVERSDAFPYPQPRPADPNAYKNDDIYGMLNEIASSSWDSIMAQNSQPVRMQRVAPVPMATKVRKSGIRPKTRVSFCLQAEHREGAAALMANPPSQPPALRPNSRGRRSWMFATGSAVGTAAFITLWVTLILSASKADSGPMPSRPRAPEKPAAETVEPVAWDAVAVAV